MSHCKHNNDLAEYQIEVMKNDSFRNGIVTSAKTFGLLALCAGGLLYGN